MKIGEVIELAYQAIMGGKLAPSDVNVQRVDIKAYLAAGINKAIAGQYYLDKKFNNGIDETTLPNSFIATYENQEVKTNEDRDLRYIDIPADTVPLPGDIGVDIVAPMKGKKNFLKIEHQYSLSAYEGLLKETYYFVEGDRIYFCNISDEVCKVLIRLMASVSTYSDDDEAPIPAGQEELVIDTLVKLFVRQRFTPADNVANATDDTLKQSTQQNGVRQS